MSICHLIVLFSVSFVLPQEDDFLGPPADALNRSPLPQMRVPADGANDVCFCTYGRPICDGRKENTCIKDPLAACYHSIEEVFNKELRQMETHHRYGCAPLEKGSHGSYLTCNSWRSSHFHPKSIACCYEGNLCNMNITPPPYVNAQDESGEIWATLGGGGWLVPTLLGLTVVFVVAIVVAYRFKKKNQEKGDKSETSGAESEELLLDSGSGSGSKALNQRTVAQNLELIETIGRGRYGDVRKARYKGSYVAVKTFYTTDEDSWTNERDIYQTTMLNHNNILQYVAADICSEDSITYMLLITDYHQLGSLCDYLRREQTLSVREALQLAYSTICGIEHLHCALQGTGNLRKPEIAHRDIKSKNIIVKRPGECCVADFGLAVRYDGRLIPERVNVQVGTKRYMAPEVLAKTLQQTDFAQFKMSDIYSFALVLWEILRRVEWQERGTVVQQVSEAGTASDTSGFCEGSETATSPRMQHMQKPSLDMSGTAKPYVPPFEGMVENDPSLDEMRRVVCEDKIRPPMEKAWGENPALGRMTLLMQECWHGIPQCRHSALKMKMELCKIIENLEPEVKKTKEFSQTCSDLRPTNTAGSALEGDFVV